MALRFSGFSDQACEFGIRAARWTCFGTLAIGPLFLIFQAGRWIELGYWADVSIGSMTATHRDTQYFSSSGIKRIIKDILWIPLWFECLVTSAVSFFLYAWLWNRLDLKRQAEKAERRKKRGRTRPRTHASTTSLNEDMGSDTGS